LATVYVKNGDVEQAIKRLRKKVDAEGTLIEYRNRMYYKSKGELRREKAKAGRRKQLKERYLQLRLDKYYE
jgi:ribosomal protein S21